MEDRSKNAEFIFIMKAIRQYGVFDKNRFFSEVIQILQDIDYWFK